MTDLALERPTRSLAAVAVVAAYAALGTILLITRFVGLNHSFWLDELVFAKYFVREGPWEILTGPGVSHELMAMLCWVTSLFTGESEVAFRLWSVVPFVAGVAIVTAWLHSRLSALSGLLFLYLVVVSPLLLDITRQARGYGLAFFAMSILMVAALEAVRTGRSAALVAMCAAGVIGTWTLPQFGLAFVTTAVVVAADKSVRRRMAVGLGISILAMTAWYAQHIGNVHDASHMHDGLQISTRWLITAPIDQIVLPGLIWIDGTAAVPSLVWLPLVAAVALVAAASPLVRDRQSLLVLTAGLIATVLVLWLGRAFVIPRYLSFFLVPAFIVLGSGAAALIANARSRSTMLGTLICVVTGVVLCLRFITIAPDVVRLPREANRDAVSVITSEAPPTTPVFVYVRIPETIAYYLGRPVQPLTDPATVAERVCGNVVRVAYVWQPYHLREVDVPCLSRAGVRHYRFRQYARGNEIDVWLVPPAS